jgi:diguanylate cyclase (GGDEF)-like protein
MKKSVIVISDQNAEIAPEITTILRASGLVVRAGSRWPFDHSDEPAKLVALIFQLPPKPVLENLRETIEQARLGWADLPVIACALPTTNRPPRWREAIVQAGFNAVAESAAQLPALLREVEETEPAQDPEPFKIAPDDNALIATESMRKQELRGAFALIASLHEAANQNEAVSFAINGLGRLIQAQTWTIFLTQNHAEPGVRLVSLATRRFSEPDLLSFDRNWYRELSEDCASSEAAASKAAMETAATATMIRRTEGRNRILAAPLVAGQRVIGVVEGVRTAASRSFSARDSRVLDAVTSSIALSLSNSVRIADAERLSLTDELTRLHNARYLRQFLVNEIKRARRYRTKISALFLDLDDFKHVNDLHGHLVGSHCLMEVAALLLPSVRDTDCVVRYGGDEFVVILPEAGPEDAGIVGERIRTKVERHRFTGGRRLKISLTVSIGAAVFPDNALSPHQLIAAADQAMYAAKAGNKNCIRLAAHPMATTNIDQPDNHLPSGEQFVRIPDEKFIS